MNFVFLQFMTTETTISRNGIEVYDMLCLQPWIALRNRNKPHESTFLSSASRFERVRLSLKVPRLCPFVLLIRINWSEEKYVALVQWYRWRITEGLPHWHFVCYLCVSGMKFMWVIFKNSVPDWRKGMSLLKTIHDTLCLFYGLFNDAISFSDIGLCSRT